MAKRRKVRSLQGSAAQTTAAANTFLVNNFTVAHLPRTYRNPHGRFDASYRRNNPLTGADNASPGARRYALMYPKSRRFR